MRDRAAPVDAACPGVMADAPFGVDHVQLAMGAAFVRRSKAPHDLIGGNPFAQQREALRAVVRIHEGLGRERADAALGVGAQGADREEAGRDADAEGARSRITRDDGPRHGADHTMPGTQTKEQAMAASSIPRDYNAAVDLIERNLKAGRAAKVAYIDDAGRYTFGEVAERVNRSASAFVSLGIQRAERIALALLDTIDFPAAFLGAIKAGIVPVALNTLLTTPDYDYMLRDSRAQALVVSEPLLKTFLPLLGKLPDLKHVIVAGKDAQGYLLFSSLLSKEGKDFKAAPTLADDICFWLYSSGSTGAPKGTVHLHSHLILTADLYAVPILGIRESDIVFSAAKLFFAYGLGNALTFPLAVGATTVLMAERPTPDAVFKRLVEHKPTIFYGVPTLYAGMLVSPNFPKK